MGSGEEAIPRKRPKNNHEYSAAKRTKDLTIDVKGIRKDENNIGHGNGKLGRNRTMARKREKG